MSRRRNALKFAFLTAALGLVALCLVALACAPAAPAGQGGAVGGAVDAESTDTPTLESTAELVATNTPTLESTAELVATNTPTLESTAESAATNTPTLESTAESAATNTPTPKATPTLFLINDGTPWPLEHPAEHDNPKLDSRLFYLALEYEEAQSAVQGASGQATQPATEVDVLIMPDAEESIPAIVKFLKDNGASPTYAYMGLPNDGYGHYQLGATLPVSLLVRLSEQSGVLFVEHQDEPWEDTAPNAPSSQSQGDRNPADAHGARAWYNAGYQGGSIAVGVIDTGFAEFSTRIKPTVTAYSASAGKPATVSCVEP